MVSWRMRLGRHLTLTLTQVKSSFAGANGRSQARLSQGPRQRVAQGVQHRSASAPPPLGDRIQPLPPPPRAQRPSPTLPPRATDQKVRFGPPGMADAGDGTAHGGRCSDLSGVSDKSSIIYKFSEGSGGDG